MVPVSGGMAGGSIPAGAGEPSSAVRAVSVFGVYPRGCGGAAFNPRITDADAGLSPRVRGSRLDLHRAADRAGSIPAGAGEPRPLPIGQISAKVYPRGCGGAAQRRGLPAPCQGLSPRVRGSLPRRAAIQHRGGSIPAGAGEPAPVVQHFLQRRVYPRGCGGALKWSVSWRITVGLSPRVRGSRALHAGRHAEHGSIPAGAGEPESPRAN